LASDDGCAETFGAVTLEDGLDTDLFIM